MNPTHVAPSSRKRALEESTSLIYGNERLISDENGYVSSMTLDGQHLQKNRRTYSEPVTGSSIHNTPIIPPIRSHTLHLGPLPSSVLKSSPTMPAASNGHVSNQLENFQLDNSGNGNYGRNQDPILVKPKPVRFLATNNTGIHTPRTQPSGLPTLASFLSPKGPSAIPATTLQEGLLPSAPSSLSSIIPSTSFSSSTINRKADSLSKRKGLVPASTNRMLVGTTDDRSSDEEFSLETELSMSQDKMQNLSVHEVLEEDLLLAQTTHSQQSDKEVSEIPQVNDHVVTQLIPQVNDQVVMQLCPSFIKTLSTHEVNSLQEGNALTIPLAPDLSPITIGRDHFLPVFGDKIRGCETFHLSRRHCVFRVTRTEFMSHQFRVLVENTSTNGLDVNGRALKYREQCELRDGDKVTLLKFRTKGEDTSLSYVISYKKGRKTNENIGIGAPPRPVIERRNPVRPIDPNIHPVQHQKSHSPAPVFISGGMPIFTDIHIDILIADPVLHSSMLSRHRPSRGYRDELSSSLTVFSSVSQLQTEFNCATSTTLDRALGNTKEIVIYAGDREMDHLVTEDDNGMSSYIDKTMLSTLANETSKSKLLIAFAPSIDCAQLFVDAGFLHVIFVNASMACRPRAISYLRALVACLLKGLTVSQSHCRARGTARGYSDHDAIGLPCVCGILPGGPNHDITLGTLPSKVSMINKHSILSTLNAALIPMMGEHFVPRDTEFAEVMKALRTRKVRVCSLVGAKGVGKSSIAVHVAKSMVDRHWYRNGVHYMNIATEIGDCNGGVTSEKYRTACSRVQNAVDELVQLMAVPDAQASDLSMFLVLDGCDAFDPAQLHNLVINALQMSPNIQILITMRHELKINSSREFINQEVIHVNELSPELAAALLLSTARVCLDSTRFNSVLPSEDELICHPALTRLKGNPLFITQLAVALKTNTLTELS